MNGWFSGLKIIVIASIFMIALRIFIFTPVIVDGASMLPTFEDGDRVIVNKQATISRFDVIVFAVDTDTNYIKRVIGLPGDDIVYQKDMLYVNGIAIEEPYLQFFKQNIPLDTFLTENFTLEKYTGYSIIPEGYLFVLGDNRQKSTDSRNPTLGLVPISSVLGKVNLVFYPLYNLGFVK